MREDNTAKLLHFIDSNNYNEVKSLLEKGVSPDIKSDGGTPILVSAASKGYWSIVKLLLDYRANVNSRDRSGFNALFWVVAGKDLDLDTIQLLIQKGADVNVKNSSDLTPLNMLCLYPGSEGVAQSAAQMSKGPNAILLLTPGMFAKLYSKSGLCVKAAELLVKSGADVNYQGLYAHPPLHAACAVGNGPMVKLLLKHKADPDKKWVCTGSTPLMMACHFRHFEIVQLLVDSGADVNARDSERMKKIAAGMFSDPQIFNNRVAIFTKNKPRPGDPGMTALDWAKASRDKQIIHYLKNKGAR